MKKITILFSAFALALVFTMQGFAQDSDQMTVSAEVLRTVDITNVTNLEFGEVLPGVHKSDEDGGATTGLFTITGAAGYDIDLSWNAAPADLEHTVTESVLPISWDILYGNDNLSLTDSWETPWDALTSEALSGTVDGGGDGNFYVEVGGTVEPADDQESGSYEVVLDLEVIYSETQSFTDPI